MKTRWVVSRALLVVTGLLFFAAVSGAAEIKVMSSAGFKAAYLELAAEFERATGHKIVNAWGPSMGSTPQAVPNRIARGDEQPVLEANPELTRPISHQMYLPTPVVFTTGVADAGDHYIVASGEADLACRITHIPKALFA
jgi:hypothetical protein